MYVNKTKAIMFNVAYISILFMYFQFLPIDIETQPIIVMLLIPLFFMFQLKLGKIKIEKKDLLLYLFFLIIIIYSFIGFFFNNIDIFSMIKFIIGPLSYLIILKEIKYLNYNCLKFMIVLLFIIFIIQITNFPLLSNIIKNIYNIFFDRWNSNYNSSRGLGVLVPEPSYFVYFAMLLLYSLDYLKSNNTQTSTKEINILKSIILVMCVFTKSASVYIFLIIYLSQYIKINSLKRIILITFIIVSILIIINHFSSSRIEEVVRSIFTSFKEGYSLLDIVFFSDASGGFRFIINCIYFLSVIIKPFGFGFGGLQTNWNEVANHFHLNIWNNLHFKYMIDINQKLDAQSYMANVVGTFGVFSIFLFAYIFDVRHVNTKWKLNIYITLIFFLVFYQSNLFNPVFWLLIAILKSKNM